MTTTRKKKPEQIKPTPEEQRRIDWEKAVEQRNASGYTVIVKQWTEVDAAHE